MNTIQKALKNLENYDLAEAFALLDSLELQSSDKPVYARLKKEFIAGKDDVDYLERLRIFIQNLDGDMTKNTQKPETTIENEGSGNITISGLTLEKNSQINIGTKNQSVQIQSSESDNSPQKNTNAIKSEVKELLADLRMEEALDILSEELKEKDDRLWDEVIQCKANLKRLELDLPTLSRQEARLEEGQIRKRILWILGELD